MSKERLLERALKLEERLGEIDYILDLKMAIDNLENGRREVYIELSKEINDLFSEIREKINMIKAVLKAKRVIITTNLISYEFNRKEKKNKHKSSSFDPSVLNNHSDNYNNSL